MEFEILKAKLNEEHKDYQGLPFWSWNNELDEKKLVQQINDMKEAGLNGFFMHARTGLKDEYLGKKWMSCIKACLKQAKKLGMEAWIYDENGWPSGFAGGKLLEKEEYRAKYLEYEVKDYFDANAYAIYIEENGAFILCDGERDNYKKYHNVYIKTSPSNTDILKPEVITAFIKETHEVYYKKFKRSFGKELVGFFTDEPQYFRLNTPYSDVIEDEFKNIGINLKEYLIYLFNKNENGFSFRSKYYTILNKLYVTNFYKRIYDWCNEHNCKLTGHSIEESSLAGQMMCSAGVSVTYEYEHMPTVDWLGRTIPNELMIKQLGSTCQQLGKKYVMTESFACCGNDVSIKDLKAIGEFQYFGGVNKLCHHLYPYSISNQAKFDHPPVFSKVSGWFDGFREFNKYFEKLGYIVGETKQQYDVGVIHPLKGTYLEYIRKDEYLSIKKWEDSFAKLIEKLEFNGITFQLIDETILANHGEIVDGKLKVGNSFYSSIIVPEMMSISRTTENMLLNYTGNLLVNSTIEYIDGEKESSKLLSNITFKDLVSSKANLIKRVSGYPSFDVRFGELGEFIFIKNRSLTEPCEYEIKNFNDYRRLDLEDLSLHTIDGKNTIEVNGSAILYKTNEKGLEDKVNNTIDVTNDFIVENITDNYLVIDKINYSFDGFNYSEKMDIQKAFDKLLRDDYKGRLFVKYTFNIKEFTYLKLVMEKAKYLNIYVNGRKVKLQTSNFDFLFGEVDITNLVILGENVIEYEINYYQHDGVHFALYDPEATESLRNCLYYDTTIENIYIKGNFSLTPNFEIISKYLPSKFGIEKDGYYFFKGKILYSGNYLYNGNGRKVIKLDGKYATAIIKINGKEKLMVMKNSCDITDMLNVGNNTIKITINVGLRNLFGPHHKVSEAVWPLCWTFRGAWGSVNPVDYVDDYVFGEVGINRIEIIE